MRISKIQMVVALLALLLVGAGCSKLPETALPTLQTALGEAQSAGAETYAPDALNQAKATYAQAQAEIEVQNGKFALFRKYTRATELLTQATTEAQAATQAAIAGKEKARLAANAAVDGARAALQAANEFLAAAPKGKNTKAELEAMGQELAALQTSLDEAVAGIAAEDYLNAKVKAEVVTRQAGTIKADIENAIAKVGAKR